MTSYPHFRFTFIIILVSVFSVFGPTVYAYEYALYVSPEGNDSWTGNSVGKPFATIQRARNAIREMKKKGPLTYPVTVYLLGGRHEISEPLVFTPEDSGTKTCPVTYTSYSGESAVISGGKLITGWKKGRKDLWTARIPGVKEGTWKFRQLYVNGETRYRPRLPKEGFYAVVDLPEGGLDAPWNTRNSSFIFKPGNIKSSWTNLNDVEIVALHFWMDVHLPIVSVDDKKHVVSSSCSSSLRLTESFEPIGARYYIDNVFEAIEEGEWYLDRKKGILNYKPIPGENMMTAEVVAPFSPQILVFEGSPDDMQFVEYIAFCSLSFMHTNYNLPHGSSGAAQASYFLPGAIEAVGAHNCSIENCTVKNVGTYGIRLKEGCFYNKLIGNELAYPGGGGILLAGGDATQPPWRQNGNNSVTDNHIHHIGEVFHAAVGLLIGHTEYNDISHNHIHHTRYSGMSVGWNWSYSRAVGWGNKIEHNHIHDCGQGWLSDMGGIYMLGIAPGTVVRNNLVHDITSYKYGGLGIYTDQASTHVLIENNIVYRIKTGSPFYQHFGRENVIRNNIWAFSQDQMIFRMKTEDHISFYFENNILMWDDNTPWTGPDIPMEWVGPDQWGNTWADDNFVMNYNVYWNPNNPDFKFKQWTFKEWQARGHDVDSVIADPMFVDPYNDNFNLKPESLAIKLGFMPIDMSTVGPRNNR